METSTGPGNALAVNALAIIAVVAVVTYLGPILTPVLIAVFLYFIIRPPADGLRRRGVPGWLAYLLLFVVTVVAIIWLGRIVHANVLAFTDRVPEYRAALLRLLDGLPGEQARAQVRDTLAQAFDLSVKDVLGMAFGPTISFLETALLVFFYLLFIMVCAGKLGDRARRAFAPPTAERVLRIGAGISDGVAQYMKVKTLVSLGMAAVHGAILYFFGVHYWPLWAVLMFVLNYVTYVGSIAALVPPLLLALVQFGMAWPALALAVLLVANRFAWIDYVEIRFSGRSLNIDPVLLLVTLAYWGWFWGAVGLVLAAPMLMGVKITLANIERTRPWALLMSDE